MTDIISSNQVEENFISEVVELAIKEKAKRFLCDEEKYPLSKLEKMKNDYEKIVESLKPFNADLASEITLLALEVAITHRIKNFKSSAELGILGEVN